MWISNPGSHMLGSLPRDDATSDPKARVLSTARAPEQRLLIINQISWDFRSSDWFGD